MPTTHFHETRILDVESDWAVHVVSFPSEVVRDLVSSSSDDPLGSLAATLGFERMDRLDTEERVREALGASLQVDQRNLLIRRALELQVVPIPHEAAEFVQQVLDIAIPVEQSPLDGVSLKDLLPPATTAYLLLHNASPVIALLTAGAAVLVLPVVDGVAKGAARAFEEAVYLRLRQVLLPTRRRALQNRSLDVGSDASISLPSSTSRRPWITVSPEPARISLQGHAPIVSVLTPQEARVRDLMALGLRPPQIAAALGLRVGTARSYISRVRRKTGMS